MKHQKLLPQKYKTYHGASQRAQFERDVSATPWPVHLLANMMRLMHQTNCEDQK